MCVFLFFSAVKIQSLIMYITKIYYQSIILLSQILKMVKFNI